MKTNFKKTTLAVLAFALMGATAAQADTGTNKVQSTNWADKWADSWNSGVYVGANIGHSNARHLNQISGIQIDNSATSYGLNLGYQVNQYFAAEVGYRDFGDFSARHGKLEGNSWDLALVGKYPITKSFAATAKLGVARTEAKFLGEKENHTTPVYGVGVEYAINNNTALTANWDRYQKFADTKLDNVTVGLKYQF